MADLLALPPRLVKKIQPDDAGCWVWHGSLNLDGYGLSCLDNRGIVTTAHRVTYQLLVGTIEPGLEIDHLCRVRRCVNPAHMEVVTRKENNRRSQVANPHGRFRKLTPEKVREIRAARRSGETLGTVAKRYGVCKLTVSRVANGHVWGHVPDEGIAHHA